MGKRGALGEGRAGEGRVGRGEDLIRKTKEGNRGK